MEYPGRLKSPTVYKCSAPVFSSKFYPSVNRSLLVSCDESGNVTFNNVSTGEVCSRWQAHNNAVFDFSWLPGDLERLVTVSGDQTAVLWDAEVKCRLSLFHGHNRSVKVISTLPDDKNLFATGSRDGTVRIWDLRCRNNSAGVIRCKQEISCSRQDFTEGRISSPSSRGRNSSSKSPARKARKPVASVNNEGYSVTSVLFHEINRLYAGTANDGYIRIWDLRRLSVGSKSHCVSLIPYPGGLSERNHGYIHFSSDSYRANLFAACADNNVYQFSLQSKCLSPIRTFAGSKLKSYYLRMDLSPCGNHLICGTTDSRANIWQVNGRKSGVVLPKWFLQGHEEEVTCVTWSPRISEVATVSDDLTWRIWSIDQLSSKPDAEAKVESAQLCTYGDSVTTMKRSFQHSSVDSDYFGERRVKRLCLSTSSGNLTVDPLKCLPPTFNLPNRVLERHKRGSTSPSMELSQPIQPVIHAGQKRKLVITPKKQPNKLIQPVSINKVKCKSLKDFFNKI